MLSLTFTYRADELIEPLESLRERQLAELADLDAEIAAVPSDVIAALHSPVDLSRPVKQQDSSDIRAAAVLFTRREDLLVGQRETELWLFECYRFEEQEWQLSLADLALIYDPAQVRKALALRALPPPQKPARASPPLPPLGSPEE